MTQFPKKPIPVPQKCKLVPPQPQLLFVINWTRLKNDNFLRRKGFESFSLGGKINDARNYFEGKSRYFLHFWATLVFRPILSPVRGTSKPFIKNDFAFLSAVVKDFWDYTTCLEIINFVSDIPKCTPKNLQRVKIKQIYNCGKLIDF